MRRDVRIICAAVVVAVFSVGGASGDQDLTFSRRPNAEDTSTISATMQILNPVSFADMNDDFQDVRVLKQDLDSSTVEVTYYPRFYPEIGENSHWREDD